MKLVLAIVHDEDGPDVMEALNNEGFSVTRLSSSGGFLHIGNTTLVVGVDNENVDRVIGTVKNTSKSRKQMVDSSTSMATNNTVGGMFMPFPIEVTVGGATIFVLDVERFEKV